MVLFDSLQIPTSLLVYETLHARQSFSSKKRRLYEQLRKGFSGEHKLTTYLKASDLNHVIPLYDCLFEVNNRELQIDCLLLTSDTIFLLEVKNYTGDYYLKNNELHYVQTNTQLYHPLTQLKRTEFLFKQMLHELKINWQVRSYVVFVNHHFMLYNASIQDPIIYPSQIERFLQKTNANAPALSERVERLANTLLKKRKQHSDYARLPTYRMEQLKRGVFCKYCVTKLKRKHQYSLICSACKHLYTVDEVVLFAIAQYDLLFPKKKITTGAIVDWCGHQFSRQTIRRVLHKHLKIHVNGRYTSYQFNDPNIPLRILSDAIIETIT